MSARKATPSSRPICISVSGVAEICAPLEVKRAASDSEMPLACEKRTVLSSRPYSESMFTGPVVTSQFFLSFFLSFFLFLFFFFFFALMSKENGKGVLFIERGI